MVYITMWKRGTEECFLVLGDNEPRLRLIDSGSFAIREEIVTADSAALLAALWKAEPQAAAVPFEALRLVPA